MKKRAGKQSRPRALAAAGPDCCASKREREDWGELGRVSREASSPGLVMSVERHVFRSRTCALMIDSLRNEEEI